MDIVYRIVEFFSDVLVVILGLVLVYALIRIWILVVQILWDIARYFFPEWPELTGWQLLVLLFCMSLGEVILTWVSGGVLPLLGRLLF